MSQKGLRKEACLCTASSIIFLTAVFREGSEKCQEIVYSSTRRWNTSWRLGTLFCRQRQGGRRRRRTTKKSISSKKETKKKIVTLSFFLAENFRERGMLRIILAIYSATTRSIPPSSLPSLEVSLMMHEDGIKKNQNTPLDRAPKTEKQKVAPLARMCRRRGNIHIHHLTLVQLRIQRIPSADVYTRRQSCLEKTYPTGDSAATPQA